MIDLQKTDLLMIGHQTAARTAHHCYGQMGCRALVRTVLSETDPQNLGPDHHTLVRIDHQDLGTSHHRQDREEVLHQDLARIRLQGLKIGHQILVGLEKLN